MNPLASMIPICGRWACTRRVIITYPAIPEAVRKRIGKNTESSSKPVRSSFKAELDGWSARVYTSTAVEAAEVSVAVSASFGSPSV